ncbi:hypothetical protein B0H13DRAFT_2448077 [Mycena leptocephala]|nr:hypothetical protein B0H13DRAFT_2448077 [Mycena leptocephala]
MSATNIPELIAESLPGSALGREGQADSSTEDKSKTEAESPEPQPSLVDTIHTVSKTPELKTQPLQDSNEIKEIHLFAGNLPFQMDDSGLFFLFSNNRIHVSWAKVKKDANGNSKGISIVSVSAHDKEEALSLNGAKVFGRSIKVEIYRWQRGLRLSAKERRIIFALRAQGDTCCPLCRNDLLRVLGQ